jgi:hypothetical protein
MKTATFVVTSVDPEAATLRDVEDQQVITLADSHDLEDGEVLRATVEPDPPLEVVYSLAEIHERRSIPIEHVDLEPTGLATDLASEQAVGEVTRRERAGDGEIHVLTVPPEGTADAVADILADEATLERAARLGSVRVEVRAADGVVSVRYLPD